MRNFVWILRTKSIWQAQASIILGQIAIEEPGQWHSALGTETGPLGKEDRDRRHSGGFPGGNAPAPVIPGILESTSHLKGK